MNKIVYKIVCETVDNALFTTPKEREKTRVFLPLEFYSKKKALECMYQLNQINFPIVFGILEERK